MSLQVDCLAVLVVGQISRFVISTEGPPLAARDGEIRLRMDNPSRLQPDASASLRSARHDHICDVDLV